MRRPAGTPSEPGIEILRSATAVQAGNVRGHEHVRDGRGSFFSSRAVSMTGMPRTRSAAKIGGAGSALIPSV